MSEAREKIDAVVAAVLSGKKIPIDLLELQGHLEDLERDEGVVWNTGSTPHHVYSNRSIPDWYDYSIDRLDDFLSEKRYDQLKAGAKPTAREVKKWREAWIEDFGEDSEWDGGYLTRTVEDSKGRKVVVLVQTSGGGWDYSETLEGVFRSREDALKAIRSNEHSILKPF